MNAEQTPFADLDHFADLRRVSDLALSPDGDRLVVVVAALEEKRTAYVSSLWEVDPAGERPARRLTWGPKSESAPTFLPDGSLLFVTARSDPDAAPEDDTPAALWVLPPSAGEARPLATRPGGIGTVAVSRGTGTLVVGSPTLPSSITTEDDAARHKARKDRKVTAVLHDSYPVRYWDHDLGPARNRLFIGIPDRPESDRSRSGGPGSEGSRPEGLGAQGSGLLELRDLTGEVGSSIDDDSEWSVSPDGKTVVISWQQAEPAGSVRQILVAIDTGSGERRVLLDDPGYEYFSPVISPDGSKVAVRIERRPDGDRAVEPGLVVLNLGTGETQSAAPGWDRWPFGPVLWTPDGETLLAVANDHGRAPVWRIDLKARNANRLTADDAAYSNLQLSPDGRRLYALRSAIGAPPAPVRLDPAATDQQPVLLRGPVDVPALPGTVTELSTVTADGSTVRAWLALPDGAGPAQPAPLLLWVHGGPLSSWNSWSWRWNPWLAVARGYAVLLPDPALSTGYGQAGIQRGWARWGEESYTDSMAITDAALTRDDLDATRTVAMGGSFGGYMANWIAGHTDRFRAIVSHAGLWSLDQFGPTTDAYYYWRRELGEKMAARYSPHRFVDQIRTPMLVIHGDRDYRVPVGEALRLWAELAEQNTGTEGADVLPHRFLLFPDENHWVLKPQNTKIWYETIFAFLAHTVLDQPWLAPDLLR